MDIALPGVHDTAGEEIRVRWQRGLANRVVDEWRRGTQWQGWESESGRDQVETLCDCRDASGSTEHASPRE